MMARSLSLLGNLSLLAEAVLIWLLLYCSVLFSILFICGDAVFPFLSLCIKFHLAYKAKVPQPEPQILNSLTLETNALHLPLFGVQISMASTVLLIIPVFWV